MASPYYQIPRSRRKGGESQGDTCLYVSPYFFAFLFIPVSRKMGTRIYGEKSPFEEAS
jgi:hypothetical protein